MITTSEALPGELESATVTWEGQSLPFQSWFLSCNKKLGQASGDPTGSIKLTDVERRAVEVGTRLFRHQSCAIASFLRRPLTPCV